MGLSRKIINLAFLMVVGVLVSGCMTTEMRDNFFKAESAGHLGCIPKDITISFIQSGVWQASCGSKEVICSYSTVGGTNCKSSTTTSVVQPSGLIGTWTLCEDPDGGPRDLLQFHQDGTGLVVRSNGSNIQFLHKQSGQLVSLLANANGRAIPIELTASSEFDKLSLHSDKTGNTSFYIRADSPEILKCSSK